MREIGNKAGAKVMDLQKEREAFEDWAAFNGMGLYVYPSLNKYADTDTEAAWKAWQAAKAESHKSASIYQLEINHLAQANHQWREKAAKSQAVPEGFVLVPKEPTREIIDALIEKIWHGYGYQEVEAHYVAIYKAMIEAQEQK